MADVAGASLSQGQNKTARGTRYLTQDKGRHKVFKKNNVLQQLSIEYVEYDSIFPNAYNPNRQSERDFELLCKSIEEDGFDQPILVDRATRTIVDGEHRWRAAHVLTENSVMDLHQIPVVFVDMDPTQQKISTLRHNRARGSEDVELTAAIIRDLKELGELDWAADSLMIDEAEITSLLDALPASELLGQDEFSEAWEPSPVSTALDEMGELQQRDGQTGRRDSISAGALEEIRKQEKKVSEAHNESERIAARKDLNVFRLSVVLLDEEADVVREVLGKEHEAENLVALCRAEKARRQEHG